MDKCSRLFLLFSYIFLFFLNHIRVLNIQNIKQSNDKVYQTTCEYYIYVYIYTWSRGTDVYLNFI